MDATDTERFMHQERYMLLRAAKERRFRFYTATSALCCGVGVVLLFQQEYLRYTYRLDGFPAGVAFLLFGAMGLTLAYLQSGGAKSVLAERDYVMMMTEVSAKLEDLGKR